VQVRDGAIVRLSTAMTGELYALLRAHSILGRSMPTGEGVGQRAPGGRVAGVAPRRAVDDDGGDGRRREFDPDAAHDAACGAGRAAGSRYCVNRVQAPSMC